MWGTGTAESGGGRRARHGRMKISRFACSLMQGTPCSQPCSFRVVQSTPMSVSPERSCIMVTVRMSRNFHPPITRPPPPPLSACSPFPITALHHDPREVPVCVSIHSPGARCKSGKMNKIRAGFIWGLQNGNSLLERAVASEQ